MNCGLPHTYVRLGVRTQCLLKVVLVMQAFGGIVTVSVGHCHPRVVAAVNKQSTILQHTTTIYLNNQIAEYAKELTDRMPGNLKVESYTIPPAPMGPLLDFPM